MDNIYFHIEIFCPIILRSIHVNILKKNEISCQTRSCLDDLNINYITPRCLILLACVYLLYSCKWNDCSSFEICMYCSLCIVLDYHVLSGIYMHLYVIYLQSPVELLEFNKLIYLFDTKVKFHWKCRSQTCDNAMPSDCRSLTKWQNHQNDCAPSEDSDQPGHPPSLIRVFAVRSIGR